WPTSWWLRDPVPAITSCERNCAAECGPRCSACPTEIVKSWCCVTWKISRWTKSRLNIEFSGGRGVKTCQLESRKPAARPLQRRVRCPIPSLADTYGTTSHANGSPLLAPEAREQDTGRKTGQAQSHQDEAEGATLRCYEIRKSDEH